MATGNFNLQNLQTGKRAELIVFGELLRKGVDIYLPMIDRGVDAVIRKPKGQYVGLQIKSTEVDDQAGYFNVLNIDNYDENDFFIICVDFNCEWCKLPDHSWPNIWILSVKEFKEFMTSGNRLPIYERSRKHGNVERYKLLKHTYKNWNRLFEESHD